eukprot:3373004-Prymnesium_polylepis.2
MVQFSTPPADAVAARSNPSRIKPNIAANSVGVKQKCVQSIPSPFQFPSPSGCLWSSRCKDGSDRPSTTASVGPNVRGAGRRLAPPAVLLLDVVAGRRCTRAGMWQAVENVHAGRMTIRCGQHDASIQGTQPSPCVTGSALTDRRLKPSRPVVARTRAALRRRAGKVLRRCLKPYGQRA